MFPQRAVKKIHGLILSLQEFLLGRRLLGAGQSAAVWCVVFLLCSPFLAVFLSADGFRHAADWFTDFNLQWNPHGGWTPSSAIVSNVGRATIMFVPVYFLIVALHGMSRQETAAQKLLYKIPALFISLLFCTLYFPNRAIGYIATFGSTPKREIALFWTFSIWAMFLALFAMLMIGKTRPALLWALYSAIILSALAGCVAA